MTPGIQVLLGAPPIVALATPLPVDLPDRPHRRARLPAARRARRAGRPPGWSAPASWAPRSAPGSRTSIDTDAAADRDGAVLLGWQAIAILRTRAARRSRRTGEATAPILGRDRGRRRPRLRTPRHRRRPRDRAACSPAGSGCRSSGRSGPRCSRSSRSWSPGDDRPRGPRPHRRGHRPRPDGRSGARAPGSARPSRWARGSGRSGCRRCAVSSRSRSAMRSIRPRRCWVS